MAAQDWQVYPAIDLRRGRVVRLRQGDPGRETTYANDPVDVARRWEAEGAQWVHVVNLDGALGECGDENLQALGRILGHLAELKVQFGGGLRDLSAARQVLELGVSRVVFGTAAVRNPQLVERALQMCGADRVVIGVDARDGRVRTHGWQQGAGIGALELAQRWQERGVRWIVFTDVSRDGMGQGLNLQTAARLAENTGLNVIASGGVASLDDVRRTYEAGLSGVIVGRALYEGDLALREALGVSLGSGGECDRLAGRTADGESD